MQTDVLTPGEARRRAGEHSEARENEWSERETWETDAGRNTCWSEIVGDETTLAGLQGMSEACEEE